MFSLTQTGTGVGSLHDGLLIQHRALRQRQIRSHPCNRDSTEQDASYRIASATASCQVTWWTCMLTQLKISHQHHGFCRAWNVIDWIPSTSQRVIRGVRVQQRVTETNLPSNLCFRKSNKAFCIMSVTCTEKSLTDNQHPDFKRCLVDKKTPFRFMQWELQVKWRRSVLINLWILRLFITRHNHAIMT